jgi:carbonic anhydrase/acetyltransferase-like protein (isoleucine patch superfamily)
MIRSFKGKMPRIAESAFVSESAYVIGDVEIGDDSSIWHGTVIRADYGKGEIGRGMKIGSNTHIEDNAVVHYTRVIGNNVVVGHGAVVEAVKVGNNVLIGDNAIVLAPSEVGSFCVIGAGAMVREGMKIPDHSFVAGMPAEIKGEVSQKQMTTLERLAANAAALAKEHKKEAL